MEMITIYAPTAIIGDGTKKNPRRMTLFSRLDILGSLVSDGLICVQADGTIIDRADDVMWDAELFMDLGPIGIVKETLRRDFWEMASGYVENMLGYPPSTGESLEELKQVAIVNKDYLKSELVSKANVNLPSGVNDAARAYTYLASLIIPKPLEELREYYIDRLNGSVEEWPPSFRGSKKTGEGVDPVGFQKVMQAIQTAGNNSPGKYLHTMYEIAYLDIIIRAL